jgi:hypothetical protein
MTRARMMMMGRRWGVGGAVLLAVWVWCGAAWGFDNEPEGWEQTGWGVSAESFLKGHKELKHVKAKEVRALLETRTVILETATSFLGRPTAAHWTFDDTGLIGVTLSWEDGRPEAYKAHEGFMADLERHWGRPTRSDAQERVWEGWKTKAVARRLRPASGSGVEVELTRFEGSPKDRGSARNTVSSSGDMYSSSGKAAAAPVEVVKPSKGSGRLLDEDPDFQPRASGGAGEEEPVFKPTKQPKAKAVEPAEEEPAFQPSKQAKAKVVEPAEEPAAFKPSKQPKGAEGGPSLPKVEREEEGKRVEEVAPAKVDPKKKKVPATPQGETPLDILDQIEDPLGGSGGVQ